MAGHSSLPCADYVVCAPGHPRLGHAAKQDVDARHKAGHDELNGETGSSCDQHGLFDAIRCPNEIRAALRLQQSDDLGVGPRAAEQKALALVATLGAKAAQLGFGLDAFGGDGHTEADAEADNRTHDRLRVAVGAEVAYERLVDLDLVERKASEIAQTGIAGAEIVHRDMHTQRA